MAFSKWLCIISCSVATVIWNCILIFTVYKVRFSNNEITIITNPDDMNPHHLQPKLKNNIALLTYVDNNGYTKYAKQLKALSCYAKRHGYELVILKKEKYTNCTDRYNDIFFIKHCVIRLYLTTQKPNLIAFVFDADVAVNNITMPLDKWISEADIIVYQRSWNFEITIGNYMIKNTPFSRKFLELLSDFEFRRPPNAFSSSDNGAVHQLLLEVLGLQNADKCNNIYSNLKHSVNNLTEYYSFVACTRSIMGPPRHWILNKNWIDMFDNTSELTDYYINGKEKKLLPSITILPRFHSWVMDPQFIIRECDSYHAFHHGVKNSEALIKYGFLFDNNETYYECPNERYMLKSKTNCSENKNKFFEHLYNNDINYIMPAKNMPWSQVPKWYLGDCLLTLSCKPLKNDEHVLDQTYISFNDEMKLQKINLSFQNDVPKRVN